jgi:hypothetical protein
MRSATLKQCAHLMENLRRFEELSSLVGCAMADFIEDCRWHFEHYLRYLSRSRHFQGYEDYIARRDGRLHVRTG